MKPNKDKDTGMNKTEARFDVWIRRVAEDTMQDLVQMQFESVKFKLAEDKCWFTPDFYVVYAIHTDCRDGDGRWLSHKHFAFDVKARWGDKPGVKDDALVKIKVAAAQFSWINWAMAWPTKDKTAFEFRWFNQGGM